MFSRKASFLLSDHRYSSIEETEDSTCHVSPLVFLRFWWGEKIGKKRGKSKEEENTHVTLH